MLWVGTGDEGGYTTSWGQTGVGASHNASLAPAPKGGHGKAVRIRNAGGGPNGNRLGYDARFGFEEAGIDPQDEAYLRYYIWFPSDYEWDTEGKLPGLQGVVPGGSPWWASDTVPCQEDGRRGRRQCHDDRQFGARTMWKGRGMITYLNVRSIGGRDHDDVRTSSGSIYSFALRYMDASGKNLTLEPGWNYVEQHVKLNTPGREDGVFEGWINGVQGIRLTNVQYRTSKHSDLRINQWELVHFWGGPKTDYPDEPTEVFYDDIAISRAPIGGRQD